MRCRVILAFETYRVGDVIEPTGLWRDQLIRQRYIEPIVESAIVKPVEVEPEKKQRRKRNERDAIEESV